MAGSSGGTGPGGTKKARIEIIPLIDVVFFLLATFVLFTLSLNKSEGPRVALPRSETAVPRDPAGSVTITITPGGTIAWNKDDITLDDFLVRLQSFRAANPGPDAKILINADQEAMFSSARYVFDQIRRVGINKVWIETRVQAAGEIE